MAPSSAAPAQERARPGSAARCGEAAPTAVPVVLFTVPILPHRARARWGTAGSVSGRSITSRASPGPAKAAVQP